MADVSAPAASTEEQVPATTPAAPTESVPTDGDAPVPNEDEETAGKQATTEVNPPDGAGTTEVAEGPTSGEAATDATAPVANGKGAKSKPAEHKGRKLNKKKSMPTLHLDCKPGELYWARLKGYAPWPAVICDEQMLPESLLATRPVSTARPDGSLRDDFKEGGKNAKDRTYPIMFLYSNEFAWILNTSLTPLDPAECKEKPKGKLSKGLQSAYELAAEGHDLQYFKDVLAKWQQEEQDIQQERAEAEAEEARLAEEKATKEAQKAAKKQADDGKKKKAPRKSKGGDGDVEMADAETPKSSKKRKKDADSDADGPKPKKTPKVTKLNAPKAPDGETPASVKKSSSKPKKKVTLPKASSDDEDAKQPLTEAEKHQQQEKNVLYLRYRLQKGFLTRDQAPHESEMPTMADFFAKLESFDNLDQSILRATNIHKVLKGIVKLVSIPREEEFNFKKRSVALLEIWNKRAEADRDAASKSTPAEEKAKVEEKAPETNGEAKAIEPARKENGNAAEGAEGEAPADKAGEKADEQAAGEPLAAGAEQNGS